MIRNYFRSPTALVCTAFLVWIAYITLTVSTIERQNTTFRDACKAHAGQVIDVDKGRRTICARIVEIPL
jgi:hypothetical protein